MSEIITIKVEPKIQQETCKTAFEKYILLTYKLGAILKMFTDMIDDEETLAMIGGYETIKRETSELIDEISKQKKKCKDLTPKEDQDDDDDEIDDEIESDLDELKEKVKKGKGHYKH